MIDWTASMQQTFEYYKVNPLTWKDEKKLDNVISCNINRDAESKTLGSASFNMTDSIGEAYVRAYLVANQNGITKRVPLGTNIIQTPSVSFDGKIKTTSSDAYTPLLELKEGIPPIGYSLSKGDNIMDSAYRICRENLRAPVVRTECTENLYNDFVSNTDDRWITFVSDLIANAKYKLGLDEMGRIIFEPVQDIESLQPVWTYNSDNSSILYSDITVDHDLYNVYNAIEVIYSDNVDSFYVKVVNDDPNSPTSTVNRGREILYRDTRPRIAGMATQRQIQEYAERRLRELSSVEYSIKYTHGYCPVRLGDCVRINYPEAGLKNVKAKVVSQKIKCEAGCQVSEKAVFTVKLWR